MGRTLHYSMTGAITDEQWDLIDSLQDRYNSKNRWTCEHLALTRIPYWYPRWPKWFKDSKFNKDITIDGAWEIINEQTKGLTGVKLENKIKELVEHKYLVLGTENKPGITASGFTKVADNELNAKLVVDFLIEASKIAKEATIYTYDEGDYILCSYVIVKQGVVDKDIQRIQEYRIHLKEQSKKPGWESYFKKCIERLENSLVLAESGIFFNRVDAAEYEDHPDFRTLNLTVR